MHKILHAASLSRPARAGVLLLAVVMLGLVTLIDSGTPWEVSFAAFYLLPVALVGWFLGRRAGIGFSIFCAAVWHFSDVGSIWRFSAAASGHVYQRPGIAYWNAVMQLGFFLVVSGVLSALKHDLDREKERALKDPLTGSPNRRAFDETATAEIRRSARYGRELSLAFLDLDDFKIMNDQMGHHEGDRLLVRVADAIRRGVRAGDFVARVGGDEFLLFFPETGSSEVNVLLTRIRSELDLLLSLENRRVTASIGAVTFVKPEGSVDAMVKMADQLMYVAKKNGKNRVEHRVVRGAHDDTRSANA